MKGTLKRICCGAVTLAVLLTISSGVNSANASAAAVESESENNFHRRNTYADYLKNHADKTLPNDELIIPGANGEKTDAQTQIKYADSFEDKQNVLLWESKSGSVTYKADIQQEGLYRIELSYMALSETNRNISLEFSLNGTSPFLESSVITLPRTYKDKTAIQQDNRGNDLRPQQEAEKRWLKTSLTDVEGVYNDPYLYFLKKGENILEFRTSNGKFAIESLRIYNAKKLPSYKAYSEKSDDSIKNFSQRVPAAEALYKSDSVLYPAYDRFSPDTIPSDPVHLKMNTIGGTNWGQPGQFIVWQTEVPKAGWYKIGLRFRQNLVRGMNSFRRLYINGEIPFEEANTMSFDFKDKWQTTILGSDGTQWLFYLKEGKNEIRMDVVPGEKEKIIEKLNDVSYTMNLIYRKILMITGAQPDENRDYLLQEAILGLLETFEEIISDLEEVSKEIIRISGGSNADSALTTIKTLSDQLIDFTENPDDIPVRLATFQSNIGSFTEYAMGLTNQPLEINYFSILSPDQESFAYSTSFLERIKYSFQAFIGTFFNDYSNIGDVEESEEALQVWVGGAVGRDQVQVIKDLVDNDFTPNFKIPVNLGLVQQGLIPAILSGRSPDISLFGTIATETPVDLAARDALMDLSKFSNFSEVTKRFAEGTMNPFKFQNSVYALPLGQSFPMLFCRTDILAELGLEPPETWEDFYHVLSVVQKNNLNVGVPFLFDIFMYQNNMTYYSEDLRKTNFDTTEAIQAFTKATQLYTDYNIDIAYNFFNRFRSGEMPIGIEDYTMFNQLSVAAPQIHGLWDMFPIPGTVQKDGSVNRSVISSSSAAVMLKDVRHPENAWKFLDWFTTSDIQAKYGMGVESLLGAAGRYASANRDTLSMLPWSNEQIKVIETQREHAKFIEVTPASYHVSRNITNAFRQVVYYNRNPRETLVNYNREIMSELQRKRTMLGLDS